ncbi:hypothetical protein J7L13_00925 [bacterium]|nr:hypothetical protein [bacterium]
MDLDKNRDVILNFGLIAVGKLRDIEQLQKYIAEKMKELRVVYCTVSAKKLRLIKIGKEG